MADPVTPRVYAHARIAETERGHSHRISPDGQSVLICLKRDRPKHRDRLRAVATDGRLMTLTQSRALSVSWDVE